MKRRENHNRGKTKDALVKKFTIIVSVMVLVFVFLFSVFGFVFVSAVNARNSKIQIENETKTDISYKDNDKAEKEETNSKEDKKINIAVFGTDADGTRTDVVFIASFDTPTKKISILSVPRDTKVVMTKEMIEDLYKRGRSSFIPYREGVEGLCKMNEIHAYAGEGYRTVFSVMQAEDLLGIDIDHYVKINLSAFREIVDAIGGVDMEVADRLYYSDPEQGLYIDIQPGYQNLDGAKAEQLVRYREGYASQDLHRIEVQQDFMCAFMKKILSTDTLLKSFPSLVKTMFKYVETDISISEALSYAKYIGDISTENISMQTIPGEGGSYFVVNEEELEKMVKEIFFE
ncbi:MAG: LCP family protein [Lachnospiraceae bacterium]|nr:LCP family protein [Lachnospiraceae bacterium]